MACLPSSVLPFLGTVGNRQWLEREPVVSAQYTLNCGEANQGWI